MDSYTPETVRAQYGALREYQSTRKNVRKGVPLPADISESLVQFVLIRLGDKTCRPAGRGNSGDLVSDIHGVFQVKSFTSDGPTSFGANTYWDRLYFLDATEWWDRDWFRVYEIDLASTDPRWLGLYFTNTRTFRELVAGSRKDGSTNAGVYSTVPVRPRCCFSQIRDQLGDACRMIFEGNIETILDVRVGFLPIVVATTTSTEKRPRVVDLFAGTGAFSLAFSEAGAVPVFANDMVEPSKRLYEMNVQHHLTLGDLASIRADQIPAHDILTGGFPCQPFSIAGQQKGFDDPRANIFFRILDILRLHRPKYILLENVKNLLRHDPFDPTITTPDTETVPVVLRTLAGDDVSSVKKKFGRTITTIALLLEREGYHLHIQLVDTALVTGLPQHRERVYITGFLDPKDLGAARLDLPRVGKGTLTSFLDRDVPERYYYTENRYKPEILQAVHTLVTRTDTLYQYRRTIIRENKSQECPTLTANMGAGGHNVPLLRDHRGVRKLTPRECFRLQGFPDTYRLSRVLSDGAHYKLAGNAVSFPIVQKLAKQILAAAQQNGTAS